MTLPEDENFQNENQPQPGNPDESSLSSGNKAADQADDQSEAESVENAPDGDYPRMDDAVEAFRRELDAIQPPTLDNLSDEPVITPVVQVSRRRRRPSPLNERGTASELGARLESIVQRASPSFDFFVFSLLCGCILAAGYILDSPAILLIGILVAPLFSPWVGASLSTATGEFRLFRQTFGGMLISLTLVFATGALGGFISRLFQPLTFSQAFFHARLWWPDLLMLVLGSLILVITFIQSDEKPVIPSIMVAYEMFLPVSAAGFGLGSGIPGLWPQAGLVFLIHLALSLIISLIILFYMGFRPVQPVGYVLTIGVILIGLVVLAGFAGLGSLINVRGDQVSATAPAAPAATSKLPTVLPSSSTPRPSAVAPTATFTVPAPSQTLPVLTSTLEPASGPTLIPTPMYGKVQSLTGGVMIRVKPGGQSITTVQNGYLVEIQGDAPVVLDGATWVHVIIKTPTRDIDGWMLLNYIVTATPSFSP